MVKWNEMVASTGEVSEGSIDNVQQGIKVQHLNLNYSASVKTLTFTGEIRSSKKASTYSIIITFTDVLPETGLTETEIAQGYQPKPILEENDVLVRCQCPSYRFRFDRANRSWRAGTGARFGTYIRKSDRAPNNPDNEYGCCKHIIEFMNYLISNGFVH